MTEEEWIRLQTEIDQAVLPPTTPPPGQPDVAAVAQQQFAEKQKAQEEQDKLQQLQQLYYPEMTETGVGILQPGMPQPNPWWENQQALPESAGRRSTGGYIYG